MAGHSKRCTRLPVLDESRSDLLGDGHDGSCLSVGVAVLGRRRRRDVVTPWVVTHLQQTVSCNGAITITLSGPSWMSHSPAAHPTLPTSLSVIRVNNIAPNLGLRV